MSKFEKAYILSFIAIFALVGQVSAKTRVAIIDFDAKAGVKKEMSSLLTDLLRSEIYGSEAFELINREDMVAILDEVKFQQSGACESTTCVVQMGQALGAEKMIAGSVGKLGKNYVITLKLVDIATAKNDALFTEYHKGAEEELGETIKKAAEKLVNSQLILSGITPTKKSKKSKTVRKRVNKKKPVEKERVIKKPKKKERIVVKKPKSKKIGPGGRSRIVAGLLGILPGAGQFYNGQITKGYLFAGSQVIAIVGTLATYQSTENARTAYSVGVSGDDFEALSGKVVKSRKLNQALVYSVVAVTTLSIADAILGAGKPKPGIKVSRFSNITMVTYAWTF